MSFAKYPGTCACGHRFAAGADVQLEKNAAGRWITLSCPACDATRKQPEAAAPSAGTASAVEGDASARNVEVRARVAYVTHRSETFCTLRVTLDGAAPGEWPVPAGAPFAVATNNFPAAVAAGDLVDIKGVLEWSDKWKWQVKASRVLPAIAGTDEALVAFLQRFPQVGQRRAEEIVRRMGGREATLKVLETSPARLTEVAGITLERAEEIGAQFLLEHGQRDALLFLAELGLTELQQTKILDTFGAETRATLLEDPYQLTDVQDIGIRIADEVANKLKVPLSDPRRIAAVTQHLLAVAAREGHTISSVEDLLAVF